MRTVHLFLDAEHADFVAFMDAHFKSGEASQWIVSADGKPIAWVSVTQSFESLEPVDLENAISTLGTTPRLWVMVDISGRIQGRIEAIVLTKTLLGRFSGVAQDDYSSRSWTLEQILDDQSGRFFSPAD